MLKKTCGHELKDWYCVDCGRTYRPTELIATQHLWRYRCSVSEQHRIIRRPVKVR